MSITDVLCDLLTGKDDMQEDMQEEILEDLYELEQGPQMYVITNKNKIFGASTIIYPGVLMEFAQQRGNFYVLPSSIHEVIFIPASENIDEEEMKIMVKEVNETQVPKEDFLSDEVYFYNAETYELQKLNK